MLIDHFYLLQVAAVVTRPFYSLFAMTLVAGSIGMLVKTFRKGVQHIQQLHQIPCSRCAYFTADYRLKCTIYPSQALTEDAINCKDFEATSCCPKLTYSKFSKG